MHMYYTAVICLYPSVQKLPENHFNFLICQTLYLKPIAEAEYNLSSSSSSEKLYKIKICSCGTSSMQLSMYNVTTETTMYYKEHINKQLLSYLVLLLLFKE